MNLRPVPPSKSVSSNSFIWQAAMAVATALLLLLSFPPFEFSFLAWVALAPLLFVLADGVGWKRAFVLGWLVGIVFTFFAENWIAHSMTHFGGMLTIVAYGVALLFAAILAVFPALFAVAMSRLISRFGWSAVAFAPLVWAATEFIRPLVTGVTWNALGVSQYGTFAIARLARHGGVYLVSAEVVAVSAWIVLILKIREPAVRKAAALLLLIGGVFFFLPIHQTQSGATITAIGVQPNLLPDEPQTPSNFARDLEDNIRVSKAAIDRVPGKSVDLVIWSESPLALFYENDENLRNRLDGFARETHTYLIANTVAHSGENYFNSVQVIGPNPNSNLKRYDKIHLVPFGEYVPWNSVLKHFVPRVISSDSGGFTAGTEAVVNTLKMNERMSAINFEGQSALERTTNFARVGSFICYEAAYPDLVRRFVQNGAGLLVNVSNDGWFGNTAGARQHLAHAVMRAIENDRDLLRVTNSGISALITSEGRIVDPLPMFVSGSQSWTAQTRRGMTFYTRHGDWFAIACLVLTLGLVALSLIGKGKTEGQDKVPGLTSR